jgi:putative Mg2+ transporter-C (MgtC) family protein
MAIFFNQGPEMTFFICMLFSVIAGYAIGTERENRGKPAGVGTHSLVIGGAMTFAFFSHVFAPNDPARIASQIVVGVGFLGAGIILRGDHGHVTNLTTAASIWFSSAIGMAIGFNYYLIAAFMVTYAVFVPRIPHVYPWHSDNQHDK